MIKDGQGIAESLNKKYGDWGIHAECVPVANIDQLVSATDSADAVAYSLHGIHAPDADGVERWTGRVWLAGNSTMAISAIEACVDKAGITAKYAIRGYGHAGMTYRPEDESHTIDWRVNAGRIAYDEYIGRYKERYFHSDSSK